VCMDFPPPCRIADMEDVFTLFDVERGEHRASLTRRLIFRVVVCGERAVSGIEQEDCE
jgi:hypothetical protein